MQIMCVEYRAHVAKAVPGYGRYLGLGAFGERLTAVPRKSLKVIPTMAALADAFRQLARNPSDVQGLPSAVVSMKVLCLWAVSTGTTDRGRARAPVEPCLTVGFGATSPTGPTASASSVPQMLTSAPD